MRDRARRSAPPGLVVVGVAALLPAAVLALLRLVPPTDDATALVASFISFGAGFALVALVLLALALVLARRRAALAVVALVAALLLAAHVTWQAPLFVPDHRVAIGPGLTLLSLNTYEGRADPDQLLATASSAAADVVVLLELTPAAVEALNQRGWSRRYPYAAGVSGDSVTNTAVFSRFPLSGSRQFGEGSFAQWATTAAVPQLGEVRVLGVHPCNPYCGRARWADDHAALQQEVRAGLGRPLVVAGDLNAVDDHRPLLALRDLGLRSATDLLGAGWLPTYPANRVVPPLLAIDHVLVDDQLTATALRRVRVAGTDHLGLVATVARAVG